MPLSSLLVATCLITIILAVSTRVLPTPAKAAEEAARALRQAQRRANQKHDALIGRLEVARNAWSGVYTDPSEGRPISILLEIKIIDQMLIRAEAAKAEVEAALQRHARAKTAELRKLHSRVWKQITILNVCLLDADESLSRLRWLTAHMADNQTDIRTESIDQADIRTATAGSHR
jgi:hypothetical protein